MRWKGEQVGGIGKIEGEFEIPELSNDIEDDGDDWEINCSVVSGEDAHWEKLRLLIQKDAPKALREALKNGFVNELKKK